MRVGAATVICALAGTLAGAIAPQPTRQTLVVRGHEEALYIYGTPTGDPVVLSSGDGGWLHLAPHVAEVLASHGFFVVGLDVKKYLEGFTVGGAALRPGDEPGDYKRLADFASRATRKKAMLIGVSEGAALSVLAATDRDTRAGIAGVIAVGLPDRAELGWRWTDSVIYLTHKAPDEPTFSVASVVAGVAPLPLAFIHSTHDEFVPVSDIQRIVQAAREPKKLWMVAASNHRFSDNLTEFDRRLLEAVSWIRNAPPR